MLGSVNSVDSTLGVMSGATTGCATRNPTRYPFSPTTLPEVKKTYPSQPAGNEWCDEWVRTQIGSYLSHPGHAPAKKCFTRQSMNKYLVGKVVASGQNIHLQEYAILSVHVVHVCPRHYDIMGYMCAIYG